MTDTVSSGPAGAASAKDHGYTSITTPVDELTRRHRLAEMPLVDPAARAGLVDVFRRRYLLTLTTRREISARYLGSKFGLAWSYINPAVRFATFYFVFGVILGRGSVPHFAIHLFAGMIVINFWSETFNAGTRSILSNKTMVQKMNLPREMFPVSSMLVSLYHTFPQLVILVAACIFTGWSPDALGFAAAGLALAIVVVFSTGMAVMFSAIGVLYRDFTRIVQTFTNMSQFAVPMMYPYTLVADRFGTNQIVHALYVGNPLSQVVLLMQRCFWWTTISPKDARQARRVAGFDPKIADNFPPHLMWRGVITLGVCLLFLVFCQWVFRRLEPKIPERI